VAGCCECGDEPSGSCATDLIFVTINSINIYTTLPTIDLLQNDHISLHFQILFHNVPNF
jgi:hypothetical protein